MSKYLESLQEELIDRISQMDVKELESFRQSVRLSAIRSTLSRVSLPEALSEDALSVVGQFLTASDLHTWHLCCKTILNTSDVKWKDLGIHRFRNILVSGEGFEEVDERSTWFRRYAQFSSGLHISPRADIVCMVDQRTVMTDIPLYRKVSCTLPARFSVSTRGTTFVRMTVGVKFSPEAVRSVIGLIGWPVEDPFSSLDCDRGLSKKYWGLAFGPLTGVVSSKGRYFDDFTTYRARHGLKDYLTLATQELVIVQVGILVHNGRAAFFRLPECDYTDWECTGFVGELKDSQVIPSAMFSQLGHLDTVTVRVNSVSEDPPYWPHINAKAMDFNNWNSFAEEGLEAAVRPPPNSPMFVSSSMVTTH